MQTLDAYLKTVIIGLGLQDALYLISRGELDRSLALSCLCISHLFCILERLKTHQFMSASVCMYQQM